MSELSEALKQHYLLKSIGVRELADRWQTSSSTVSRFLNGKPIAAATFLKIIYLLTEDDK